MSRQSKRGGGKRLREEHLPPCEEPSSQSFSPVNPPPHASPTYGGSSFSDAYPIAGPSTSGPSSMAQPQSLGVNPHGAPGKKVAIPTLRTPQTAESLKTFKKGRTAHACDGCRRAKASCSGGQPCSRCKMTRSSCIYGDGKRDREKKEMSNLNKEINQFSRHNSDVREALQQVRDDASLSLDGAKLAIDGILQMTLTVSSPNERANSPILSMRRSTEFGDVEGEEEADAEVGSTRSLDIVGLDMDRNDTRATGYMGKSSAVRLQQRTANEISGHGTNIATVGIASYHTEDSDVAFVDTSGINMYEWPDANLADMLIQNYFEKVHSAFPILDKGDILSNYASFPAETGRLSQEKLIWLASLNTVFAISAVYAHLTMSAYRGHHHDHLIYIARARMIFVDQETVFQDSRISSASLMGLLSLYYMCTCRLNKAWTLSGLAIRHAIALGLHVRCEADTVSEDQKEHRVRIWWSLYSLECSLSELTGRPTSISDRDISTPTPLNINEDTFTPSQKAYDTMGDAQGAGASGRRGSKDPQGSRARPPATYQMPKAFKQQVTHSFPPLTPPIRPSSSFIYRTQLSIVAHEITTDLYCAATVKEKWSDVEHTIYTIDQHLIAWAAKLPTEFDVSFEIYSKPDINNDQTLSRAGLAMSYNFSRMILFRPCLCRIDGRIPNQSAASKSFIQLCIQQCLKSARRTIALITWYSASPSVLYTIPPFWNTLHCLCEALSVLILELAFKGLHVPTEIGEILTDCKRGVNWLAMMASQSISARKAWEIFDGLIRLVAPMINWSVFDMPAEAPVPPGYNIAHFNKAGQSGSFERVRQENAVSEDALAYPETDSTGPPSGWGNREPTVYSSFDATTLPPPAAPEGAQVASNPLNTSSITERFFTIGQLHGHFDDPWQHIFDGSAQDTTLSMINLGLSMLSQAAGQASELGQGGQLHSEFGQGAADAYDLANPDMFGAYPPDPQQ